MGTEGFESEEDIGGPVYVQNNNNGTTTVQALGHVVATNNNDPQHKLVYYMPIDKVLTSAGSELLTHVPEEKKAEIEIETSE